MRGWTPQISVKVNGKDVSDGFYGRLVEATIRDEEGQNTDKLTIKLDDDQNAIEIPAEGAMLAVSLGYRETGLVSMGLFEFQSYGIEGDEEGEFVVLQAESASLQKGGEKAGGRESFEGKTFGEIARDLAKREGLQAVIDAKLEKIKVPYIARIGQSPLDFLTRLADRHNGVLKRAGGKLAISERGSGKSAGGSQVPPILISRSRDVVKDWNITSDPRPRYGEVQAAWIDQKTGKREVEKAETGFDGPKHPLRHPFPTKEEAKSAAEAEAARLSTATGQGHFTLYGRPEASAGADVIASGFRAEARGPWRCPAVDHTFRSGRSGGYLTKVEVKAPEKGKKGGKGK